MTQCDSAPSWACLVIPFGSASSYRRPGAGYREVGLDPIRPEPGEVVIRVRCGVCDRRVLTDVWGHSVTGPRLIGPYSVEPAELAASTTRRWDGARLDSPVTRYVVRFYCHRRHCRAAVEVEDTDLCAAFTAAAADPGGGVMVLAVPGYVAQLDDGKRSVVPVWCRRIRAAS